jgi:hypothetical protein
MLVVKPPRAREQPFSGTGQMKPVRPAVERHAAHQPAPLELAQERDEVRLLDPQRAARPRLQKPRIAVDDGEHGELRRAQIDFRERADEIAEQGHLRPAQRIPHVLGERSELAGVTRRDLVRFVDPPAHARALRLACGLTPAARHGYSP